MKTYLLIIISVGIATITLNLLEPLINVWWARGTSLLVGVAVIVLLSRFRRKAD